MLSRSAAILDSEIFSRLEPSMAPGVRARRARVPDRAGAVNGVKSSGLDLSIVSRL